MKVSGTGKIGAAGAGAGRPAQAASGFRVDMGQGPTAARATLPTHGVGSVDALLALQTVPSATDRRRRSIKRGNNLLDLMGDVHLGLLDGAITEVQVDKLKRIVQTAREPVDDPGLAEVLDHIDLRAQVELAKLGIFP
jgi:hypothetical protein